MESRPGCVLAATLAAPALVAPPRRPFRHRCHGGGTLRRGIDRDHAARRRLDDTEYPQCNRAATALGPRHPG